MADRSGRHESSPAPAVPVKQILPCPIAVQSVIHMTTGANASVRNDWHSVRRPGLMWPGEYQNAVDTCGDPHKPWGVNPTYFECCTGTPFADGTRASAFVATDTPPLIIAMTLRRAMPQQGTPLEIEDDEDDEDEESDGEREERGNVYVCEGSSTLFSITRLIDSRVGGPVCVVTAFSSTACAALASQAAKFMQGTCTIVPHGRFESIVQTKLGPKRLVRLVGINEHDMDSTKLAAHFTVEDDTSIAYQPCPADDETLADHVIARGVLAFCDGGWDPCIGPTIESIVARRDYHGHELTRCLFDAVEKWFLREWTLDTQEGLRILQATQMTNAIVEGDPMPGGGGGGEYSETGACRGLIPVTDNQLMYEDWGFRVNLPAEGTISAMMSANQRKEIEGMKIYPRTKFGSRKFRKSEVLAGIGTGWRSCDYCLVTESKPDTLMVCTGCLCEHYYAGRYCSERCQKEDRPRHELSCGKTRSKMMADYHAFFDGQSH